VVTLVALIGPTAVGKTEISHRLTERIPFEIVSCDSMQVYRGMDIGTGKPSPDEKERYHYHMIDIVSPHHRYSAGEYVRDASRAIENIAQREKIPLVVGGTGMYLDSLLYGISSMPEANLSLRRELMEEVKREGISSFHERLEKVDPESARRIHPDDVRRIVRALEVYYLTGKPISEIQREEGRVPRYNHLIVGIYRARNELYERINARVEKMFEEGLVKEVAGLLERGCGADLPALQALGYKEVMEFLNDVYDLEEAKRRIKKNTRNFAKRQMTYFRKNKEIRWFKLDEERERIIREAEKFLSR